MKVLKESSSFFYVKAPIKKSYGQETRPAILLFKNGFPVKAHCNCPVGVSGLCCHVLAVLLFLKHFHESGEKILELTCTEQLQTWHRRTKTGSIPMTPLKEISVKSARKKKSNLSVSAADPENSSFKRNISAIIKDLNRKLDSEKPVTEHIYYVLSSSEVGRNSSVGQHLLHMFKLNQLGDHQYLSKKNFESYVFGISENKRKKIQEIADGSCINKNENELGVKNFLSTQEIVTQVELKIILEKSYNVYDTSCKYYQDMASDIHTIEPRSYEDFFVLPLVVYKTELAFLYHLFFRKSS